MDAALAIASKRDRRRYSEAVVSPEVVAWILQCGHAAGSGKNRQDRRFVILDAVRQEASRMVTRPRNVQTAALVITVVSSIGPYREFDAGRAAQNMMLGAWEKGLISCPNAIADHDGLAGLLGLGAKERAVILLSFGHPPIPADPTRRSPSEWIGIADRRPLGEVIERR